MLWWVAQWLGGWVVWMAGGGGLWRWTPAKESLSAFFLGPLVDYVFM